jgi:uncharacterized protein YbgA (DUF1722 family)
MKIQFPDAIIKEYNDSIQAIINDIMPSLCDGPSLLKIKSYLKSEDDIKNSDGYNELMEIIKYYNGDSTLIPEIQLPICLHNKQHFIDKINQLLVS